MSHATFALVLLTTVSQADPAAWQDQKQVGKLPIYLVTRGQQLGIQLTPEFVTEIVMANLDALSAADNQAQVVARNVVVERIDVGPEGGIALKVEGSAFAFSNDFAFLGAGLKLPAADGSIKLKISAHMGKDKPIEVKGTVENVDVKSNVIFGLIDGKFSTEGKVKLQARLNDEREKITQSVRDDLAKMDLAKTPLGELKSIEYGTGGVYLIFEPMGKIPPVGQKLLRKTLGLALGGDPDPLAILKDFAAWFIAKKFADLAPRRNYDEPDNIEKKEPPIEAVLYGSMRFKEIIASKVDASKADVRVMILGGRIDKKSDVKVNASGGKVFMVSKLDGESHLTVNAPGGSFDSVEPSGFGREGSKVDGDSKLDIVAANVTLRGVINGTDRTVVTVTLTKGGSLSVRELKGHAIIRWRKEHKDDPEPVININRMENSKVEQLPPAN